MAKQATLKELVLGAVEGFLATDTPFSVHDLTTSIRQVVNSGAIEIPALYVSGQAFKYDISHDDVKFYFSELNDAELFSQLLARKFNGTFNVFRGADSPAVSNPLKLKVPSPFQGAAQAIANLGNALGSMTKAIGTKTPSIATAVQQASAGKLGRTEVVDRVRLYLSNCDKRGINPTNKQIQSAIKRGGKSTGWTRSDLDQIRQGINNGSI